MLSTTSAASSFLTLHTVVPRAWHTSRTSDYIESDLVLIKVYPGVTTRYTTTTSTITQPEVYLISHAASVTTVETIRSILIGSAGAETLSIVLLKPIPKPTLRSPPNSTPHTTSRTSSEAISTPTVGQSSNGQGNQVGIQIGVPVALITFLGSMLVLIWFQHRCRRRKRQESENTNGIPQGTEQALVEANVACVEGAANSNPPERIAELPEARLELPGQPVESTRGRAELPQSKSDGPQRL